MGVSALPPGPRSRLLTTFEVARKPYLAMAKARQRYGDPFSMTTINGRVVVTAEPELIREIFTTKDTDRFEPFASEAMTPFFGRQSLLLLQGDPHRRERKLLTPPFHGERMRAYGETIATVARRIADAQPRGQTFTALEYAQRVSLEVIVRAVFGVEDRVEVEAFVDALRNTLNAALPMFMFSAGTHRAPFGLGPWARYQRESARVDELLYRQIAAVRPVAEGREDILSLLLRARYEDGEPMRDAHVRDELRTLLIAGHETTATTLAWALELLHRHSDALARLLAELDGCADDVEALAKLPYLGAVVDETLRLRPVVEVVFRKLRAPWQLGGYALPAGIALAPAIMLVHMRDDIYAQPHEFRPERMLERKPSPFEFLPFGGGHRRCIGAAFAHYEAKIVLATLLRAWTLELREQKPVEVVRQSLALGPGGGVRMAVVGARA